MKAGVYAVCKPASQPCRPCCGVIFHGTKGEITLNVFPKVHNFFVLDGHTRRQGQSCRSTVQAGPAVTTAIAMLMAHNPTLHSRSLFRLLRGEIKARIILPPYPYLRGIRGAKYTECKYNGTHANSTDDFS